MVDLFLLEQILPDQFLCDLTVHLLNSCLNFLFTFLSCNQIGRAHV